VDFRGAEDELLEAFDEEGGVAYGGHHAVALDAGFFGVGAAFDVDFVQGFDVFGDEGDWDDEHLFYAFVAEFVERGYKGGLEPLGRADLALETKEMDARPVGKLLRAAFTDEANRFADVAGVGITVFD